MKNNSPSRVQVDVKQTSMQPQTHKKSAFSVNEWVKKALTAKKNKGYTAEKGTSQQHVEVHFAFSKSILNKKR